MLAIIFAVIVTVLLLLLAKPNFKNLKKYTVMLITVFVTTAFVFIIFYNITFFKNIISESEYIIYDIFVLVITSMSIAILIDGVFAFIFQKVHETRIINSYEKKYNAEEYEYYRDIIKNISPAILSYCYNKKINVEDEVVAVLLNLQHKNIIKLNQDTLTVLGDTKNLSIHEKYILGHINNIDNKQFRKLLIEDMEKKNYVKTADANEMNIVYIMEYFMLWMILYILVAIPIFMGLSNLGIMLFLAYFLTFIGIPIYKVIQEKINPAIRTEEALSLSGKLAGLKNYIKDYSNIKDFGIENINLYDEYVIYAVIFNIKGKLDTECRKIYRNTKDLVVKNGK